MPKPTTLRLVPPQRAKAATMDDFPFGTWVCAVLGLAGYAVLAWVGHDWYRQLLPGGSVFDLFR